MVRYASRYIEFYSVGFLIEQFYNFGTALPVRKFLESVLFKFFHPNKSSKFGYITAVI